MTRLGWTLVGPSLRPRPSQLSQPPCPAPPGVSHCSLGLPGKPPSLPRLCLLPACVFPLCLLHARRCTGHFVHVDSFTFPKRRVPWASALFRFDRKGDGDLVDFRGCGLIAHGQNRAGEVVLFGQAVLFEQCALGCLAGLRCLVPARTPLLHLLLYLPEACASK